MDTLIAEFNTGGDFFLMRQADQQGKDPNKTYFATEMRKYAKQEEGRAAGMALVQAEHHGNLTFFPVAGTMNKYWGVIDKVLTREQVSDLLKKTNKIQDRDKKGQLKAYMSFAMQKVTTHLEGSGGRDIMATRGYPHRRNTATVAITGWPQQAEPGQVQAVFKHWGLELDLKTVTIDWYFGVEAEGYTLKIETADLSKAREILLLRERLDFDMGVGELTAMQQSHLRLIATTPKSDTTVGQHRYPKPTLQKILSETQIMEIKKSGQYSPGNPPPKSPEKTILGKKVPAESQESPLVEKKDEWKDVEKTNNNKKKKKNKTPTASISTAQTGEISNLNAYGVLGDQEGDEMEEESPSEEENEKEKKEEKEAPSPKKKSQKRIDAEDEQKEKNAIQDKFKSLRKRLSAMKLWGRAETATMVEAYIVAITVLGYEVANDELEHLLGLEREKIKEEVEMVTSGKTRAELKAGSQVDKATPSEVPIPDGETPQSFLEEKHTETTEEDQDLVERLTNVGSTNAETLVAQGSVVQGKEGASVPSTTTDPPDSGSSDVVIPHPPDPGPGDLTEVLNLSSVGNIKTTILDFFSVLPPQ